RHRDEWRKPLAARAPANLQELPPDVLYFVNSQLLPRLTTEQMNRLKAAEGRPAPFLQALGELALTHPVLPPLPSGAIKTYRDLPFKAKQILPRASMQLSGKWKGLAAKEGHWPDFALGFTALVPSAERSSLPPLGASHAAELPPSAQPAVDSLIK